MTDSTIGDKDIYCRPMAIVKSKTSYYFATLKNITLKMLKVPEEL